MSDTDRPDPLEQLRAYARKRVDEVTTYTTLSPLGVQHWLTDVLDLLDQAIAERARMAADHLSAEGAWGNERERLQALYRDKEQEVDDKSRTGHAIADAWMEKCRELEAENERLTSAAKRVRDIHTPVDAVDFGTKSSGTRTHVCTGCGQDDGNWNYWPCDTVRALGEAEPTTRALDDAAGNGEER